jgi:hypothetical protein
LKFFFQSWKEQKNLILLGQRNAWDYDNNNLMEALGIIVGKVESGSESQAQLMEV